MKQTEVESKIRLLENNYDEVRSTLLFQRDYLNEISNINKDLKDKNKDITDRVSSLRNNLLFLSLSFGIAIIILLLGFQHINKNIDYVDVTVTDKMGGATIMYYDRSIYSNVVCESGVHLDKEINRYIAYSCLDLIDNHCSGDNKVCIATKRVMKFRE